MTISLRRPALLASICGAFTLALAQPALAAAPNAADLAQLTRQANDWDAAIVRKDRAAIETNMAEDFRQIDGDADIENKASFVESLMSPKLKIDPYTVEDFEVRQYGDTALISGRTKMTGSWDGKPFSTHYRYIDIYAKQGGAWKIVSVQITRLAKP
ncbi:MAG TPA: nuclear transport factor 2 family protein [Ideonella sp.]|uniref:nuclear transport factor 2 family protein n=1 Tax=Ideonella sp. TaxID=1929293 RepID=UPI002E3634A1|nr:nuclear transport factor 2 family protein [Ideonella sp.]HEX5685210.1 nuclear transport factor 2 family protein [Ideonella sp.]